MKYFFITLQLIFVLGLQAQNKYYIDSYNIPNWVVQPLSDNAWPNGLLNLGKNQYLYSLSSVVNGIDSAGYANSQYFIEENGKIELLFDDLVFGYNTKALNIAAKNRNNFLACGVSAEDTFFDINDPTYKYHLGYKNNQYNTYQFQFQPSFIGSYSNVVYNKDYYYCLGSSAEYAFDNDSLTNSELLSFTKIDTNHQIVFDTVYPIFWDLDCIFVQTTPSGRCEFLHAVPSKNNSIYTIANIQRTYDHSKLMLSEIDSIGNIVWHNILDVDCDLRGWNLRATEENIYVSSFKQNSLLWEDEEHIIYKLDLQGNIISTLQRDTAFTRASAMLINNNKEIVNIGEYLRDGYYWVFPAIEKLDSNGNLLWLRELTDLTFHWLPSGKAFVFENNDKTGLSGYVAAAALGSSSSIDMIDYYFVKLNCMGLPLDPISKFSTATSNNEISYFNESLNIFPDSIDGGYYVFNFGDGDTLLIESDSTKTFTHTFTEPNYYQTTLNSYLCIDTSIFTATVCPGMPLPNINLDFSFETSEISDSTVLISIENNSSNLSQYFGNYYWQVNQSAAILNNSNNLEIEHNKDSTIVLTLQSSLICDSIFTLTKSIDLILSNNTVELQSLNTDQIQFFPNPFDNYLVINNLPRQQTLQLKIYNAQGKLVLTKPKLNENQTIATNHFLKGIYFYKVENYIDEIQQSGKFIKQ